MYHFLTLEDVVTDQQLLLERYGGGRPGILNQGQLESALFQPLSGFAGMYFHCDVFEMAGAYLRYLAMAHAFGNANKRIALSSALRFLYVNGIVTCASSDELVQLVLRTVTEHLDTYAVAEFFKTHYGRRTSFKLAMDDDTQLLAVADASSWVQNTYDLAFRQLADM